MLNVDEKRKKVERNRRENKRERCKFNKNRTIYHAKQSVNIPKGWKTEQEDKIIKQ